VSQLACAYALGRHVVGWRHGQYLSLSGAVMMRYYNKQSAIIGFHDGTRVGDESSLDISQQSGKQVRVGKGKMTRGMEVAIARTWQQQKTCTESSQEWRSKRQERKGLSNESILEKKRIILVRSRWYPPAH
jgi:hypothetical protein